MVPVFWSLVGVHILKESLPLHERRFIVRFRSRLLSGATREDADEGNCGATRGCGEGSTCRPFHLVMCALKCPAYSRRAVRLSRFRITLCSPPIFPSPSEREGQRPSGSRESGGLKIRFAHESVKQRAIPDCVCCTQWVCSSAGRRDGPLRHQRPLSGSRRPPLRTHSAEFPS